MWRKLHAATSDDFPFPLPSFTKHTRVNSTWILSKLSNPRLSLRETQRVINVAALSSSWCPFRFYKWKWSESLWDGPWQLRLFLGTGCPGRQRWQSCQMSLFERHINTFCALVFSSLLLCKQTVFVLNRLPLLARSYWSSGWLPAEPGQQWAAHWHSLSLPASQPMRPPLLALSIFAS